MTGARKGRLRLSLARVLARAAGMSAPEVAVGELVQRMAFASRPNPGLVRCLLFGLLATAGVRTASAQTMSGSNYTISQNTSGNIATYTITNDEHMDAHTFYFRCETTGKVTACQAPGPVTLAPGAEATVTATYSTGTWGSATLALKPGTSFGLDEGDGYTSIITVTSPPQPSILSTAPHNDQYLDPNGCAAGCFRATAAYSTPAYVSGGVGRSATLVYSSAAAAPTGLVHLEATNNSSTPASKISIRLRRNGAWLTDEVHYASGFGTSRLAAQFDASSYATGLYAVEAVIRHYFTSPDSVIESSTTVKVPVLGQSSAVGIGWRILGVQRLSVTTLAAVVIDQGDGSLVRFDSTGSCSSHCSYTSPLEYSRVTKSTTTGDTVPWVRHYPDSSRSYFRVDGRMSYHVDRAGNRTQLSYATSAVGEVVLASLTDPLGKVTQFAYESTSGGWKLGTLRTIVTPGNRASWFGVDQSGDLRQLKDPDGVLAWQMTYDAAHRLTTRLDRRGHSWRYAYDFAGRVAADSFPAIPIDGGALQTPVVHYVAPITRVLVNPAGGLGTSANPAPRVDVTQVTGSVTDPGGRATTFTTDPYGLPLRTTDPQGRVTIVTRSGLLPTRVDLPTGHWQIYEYSSGRLRYSLAKGETQISYLHGTKGELTEISQTGRPTTRYFTDAVNGRIDSVRIGTNPASKKFTYDSLTRDRVLRVTDAQGHGTRFHYDAVWSNVDSTIGDGNRVSTTQYDAYGRAIQSRTNSQPTQSTAYDVLNRVWATHDGVLPDSTLFEYPGGLLTRVRDPKRQVYRFEYNALGWQTKRFDAADTLLAESFGHNIDGLVTRYTNRRNELVTYGYDNSGRLLSRTGAGVEAAHFRYDSLKRLTVDSNAIVKTETFRSSTGWVDSVITTLPGQNKRFLTHYVGDSLGRLSNVNFTNNAGIAFAPRSLAYDLQSGLLVSITVNGQSFGYGYNSGRELTQRYLPGGGTIAYTGTAIHRPADVAYSDAVFQTLRRGYGYDSLRRVSEVHSRNSTGSVLPTQYYYDNRTQLMAARADGPTACPTVPDTTFGYGYNCISEAPPTDTAFRYDSVGNRRDRGGTYAPGNRLAVLYGPTGEPSTGYQYEWDADGNIRRKYWRQNPALGDYRYSWTPDGKLAQVHRFDSGETVDFEYSATGQLVRKKRNGRVDRYYLWAGAQVLAELDSLTKRVAEYVYQPGIDRPLALVTTSLNGSTLVRAFAQDELGNVIGVLDPVSRTIDQAISYDPWGKPSVTGTLNDSSALMWKGLLWQGGIAGLYYMRNRWYDPDMGRFMSEDPIGIAGGINKYVFAENDPVNGSDPSGLSSEPNFSCSHGICGDDWFYGGDISDQEPQLGFPGFKKLWQEFMYEVRHLNDIRKVVGALFTAINGDATAPPRLPIDHRPPPAAIAPTTRGPRGGGPRLPGASVFIPLQLYQLHQMMQEMTPYTPEWMARCTPLECA